MPVANIEILFITNHNIKIECRNVFTPRFEYLIYIIEFSVNVLDIVNVNSSK